MRVADFHTYFVGCDEWGFSVWAHNTDCANPQAIKDVAGVKPAVRDRAARIMREKGEAAAIKYLEKQGVPTAKAKEAIEASKVKLPAPVTDKTYARPGGTDWRKGEREAVWEAAKKASPDGIVRDPLTGKEIKFTDKWDMGHKPKYEFWKHQQSAKERGLTREQFLDEYHKPEHFRPELPGSNQGHFGEDTTAAYLGP